MTSTTRITVTAVDAMEPHTIIRDTDVKGFVARRQSGDTVSFLLVTRIKGRSVKLTIGKLGSPWTVDSARKEARRLLVEIDDGHDIQADRNAAHDLATVKEAAHAFLTEYCGVDEACLAHVAADDPKALTNKGNRRKLAFKLRPGTFDVKPRTAGVYRDALMDHIIPKLGTRRVDSIGSQDFEALRRKHRDTPRLANFLMAVSSTMITWAMSDAVKLWPKGVNPVEGITRYDENRRDKALTPDEMKRVFEAISKAEADETISPYSAAALRFLAMTGLRPKEALAIKWSEVNLATSSVHLPDTKTGARDATLSTHAMELLSSLPQIEGNPYVFVGAKDGKPLASLQHAFETVRDMAELPDGVVLYTMRHNFGSTLADAGVEAYDLMKMMGHKHLATSLRYIHQTKSKLAEKNTAATRGIGEAYRASVAGPTQSAKASAHVVALPRTKRA